MEDKTIKKIILIILLVVITVVVRLHYTHQNLFDSFWVHGMADSISRYGYAKWVFHPLSLVGLFPLSQPSGNLFFLSSLSLLTGRDMNITILLSSLLLGLFGVLSVYIFAKKIFNEKVAFISAIIFSLSSIYIMFTSWNASNRIFFIVQYPFFLWTLIKIYESNKKGKYILIAILQFTLMMLSHRMFQFSIIFFVAYFLTITYFSFPLILRFLSKFHMYEYLSMRYKKSGKYLVFDGVLIILVLVVMKIIDLALRNRLLINVTRQIEKIKGFYALLPTTSLIDTFLIGLIILIVMFYVLWLLKRRTGFTFFDYVTYIMKQMQKKPEFYFSVFLLFMFTFYFVKQFLGKGIYSLELGDYYSTEFFTGGNPLILFLNMSIN